MNPFAHMIMSICQPYTTINIQELPVFKPNEFFIKQAKEKNIEPWVYYMETVRKIMGEVLNFELSE